jgi:hypothetical protein
MMEEDEDRIRATYGKNYERLAAFLMLCDDEGDPPHVH